VVCSTRVGEQANVATGCKGIRLEEIDGISARDIKAARGASRQVAADEAAEICGAPCERICQCAGLTLLQLSNECAVVECRIGSDGRLSAAQCPEGAFENWQWNLTGKAVVAKA